MAVLEQTQQTTATAAPAVGGPTATAPAPSPWAARRFGALGSTPRRLRVLCTSILVLVAVTGVLAVAAVAERQASIDAARNRTASLEVDAQAVDIALSDADATIAGSFLQGRIEPAALRAEYLADVARASSGLSAAALSAGPGTAAQADLRVVSTELPAYTGLVATAADTERQASYPLAAAYLAEANNLMRTQMLPDVTRAYTGAEAQLSTDQSDASGPWLPALAGGTLVLLLAVLVVAQVWMGRRFRRTLNVPLVVASVLVLAAGVWFGAALAVQDGHVSTATSSGSSPLGEATRSRILALELRSDDELTLLTRDSVPSYQRDAAAVTASLTRLLSRSAGTGAESELLSRARVEADSVTFVHDQIRAADASGNLSAAVGLAAGTGRDDLLARSTALDGTLTSAVDAAQQAFGTSMAAASGDLATLGLAVIVLLLVSAGLVWIGFRPRIAEYR